MTQEELLRVVVRVAPHFMGGRVPSSAGSEIAALLDIPQDYGMRDLIRAARRFEFDPLELWPWLTARGEIAYLEEAP